MLEIFLQLVEPYCYILFVDSVQLERDLISHQEKYQRENTMIRITPFETRQSPNISSQL
nr:hypothetical protein [Staphylococcus aureus]